MLKSNYLNTDTESSQANQKYSSSSVSSDWSSEESERLVNISTIISVISTIIYTIVYIVTYVPRATYRYLTSRSTSSLSSPSSHYKGLKFFCVISVQASISSTQLILLVSSPGTQEWFGMKRGLRQMLKKKNLRIVARTNLSQLTALWIFGKLLFHIRL